MAGKENDIQWALDLLAPDPSSESVLGNWAATIASGGAGFATACFVNWSTRRPIWSGIQKHISFPIIFACAGRFLDLKSRERVNERDAMYRHYITLHPEDFPAPERKKFGETMRPWVPVR